MLIKNGFIVSASTIRIHPERSFPHSSPKSTRLEPFSGIVEDVSSCFKTIADECLALKFKKDFAKENLQKALSKYKLIWDSNRIYIREREYMHIFEDQQIIVKTKNIGKYEDIPKYVRLKRSPLTIDREAKQRINETYCFIHEEELLSLSPVPLPGGKCHGAVQFFLKEMLITQDIIATAKKFVGGVPMEAAIFQELYSELPCSPLRNLFIYLIIFHEKSFSQLKDLIHVDYGSAFKRKYTEQTLHVLEGIHVFFSQGGLLQDEEFVPTVTQWVNENYHEPDTGELLALQEFYTQLEVRKRFLLERDQASNRFVGLKEDRIVDASETEEAILATFDDLGEGAYFFAFPVYGVEGLVGMHAVGIFIQDGIYFYDPNEAIAITADLKQTIRDLFQKYNCFEPAPKQDLCLSRVTLCS